MIKVMTTRVEICTCHKPQMSINCKPKCIHDAHLTGVMDIRRVFDKCKSQTLMTTHAHASLPAFSIF